MKKVIDILVTIGYSQAIFNLLMIVNVDKLSLIAILCALETIFSVLMLYQLEKLSKEIK